MPGDPPSTTPGQHSPTSDHVDRPAAQIVGKPADATDKRVDKKEPTEVTCFALVCYHTFGFLAYWFGAARFDMDGDGDFDAADVQQIINLGSKHLHLNFSRPPRNKELQRKRRAIREERKRKREADIARREQSHQEIIRKSNQHGGLAGALGKVEETVAHSLEVGIERIEHVLHADIEGDDEEAEILANLGQYWPWFTIIYVLIIIVLWGVFAGMKYPYDLSTVRIAIPDGTVLREFRKEGTLYRTDCERECDGDDACRGYAFREGPFAECRLLSEFHQNDLTGSINKVTKCSDTIWNWHTYRKGSWDLGEWAGADGGLESWLPGHTALTSYHFCEEGYQSSFLYRWWSYQFTHADLLHVLTNAVMAIFTGVPLEGLHGTGMLSIMWTTGVLGGALCWVVFDPYRTVYGASAGCFALLGMHGADLAMHWRQKKFRWPCLVLLLLLTGAELAVFWISGRSEDQGADETAHSVHAGGLVAGLLIGICAHRNIHHERWEQRVQAICWIVGVALCAVCITWWFAANPFPGIRSAWSLSERPWCWIGHTCVGDDGDPCPFDLPLVDMKAHLTQCVFCDSRACVEGWYSVSDGGQYPYCPRSQGRSDCHESFNDSWDLFYPPSESHQQR